MDFGFLLKLLVKYLEDHPDVVEKLIDAGVKAAIQALEQAQAKPA